MSAETRAQLALQIFLGKHNLFGEHKESPDPHEEIATYKVACETLKNYMLGEIFDAPKSIDEIIEEERKVMEFKQKYLGSPNQLKGPHGYA